MYGVHGVRSYYDDQRATFLRGRSLAGMTQKITICIACIAQWLQHPHCYQSVCPPPTACALQVVDHLSRCMPRHKPPPSP